MFKNVTTKYVISCWKYQRMVPEQRPHFRVVTWFTKNEEEKFPRKLFQCIIPRTQLLGTFIHTGLHNGICKINYNEGPPKTCAETCTWTLPITNLDRKDEKDERKTEDFETKSQKMLQMKFDGTIQWPASTDIVR